MAAATSLGASHLVLCPRAGMLYGPALLWLLLVVYLVKYPAFEFGPRYALATGKSLIAGFAAVPGPRHWALWVFLVLTAAQGIGVALAVTAIAASVLRVSLGILPLSLWGILVSTTVAALLWTGGFPALESANKVMLALLALVTLVTFLASPPPTEMWLEVADPHLPAGSVVLVAAIAGWLPTGIDVSIWHSLWALEVSGRWEEKETPGVKGRTKKLRHGLLDMRIGYGLSFALALIFLFLGMRVPATEASAPDGARVAVAISQAYTETLGHWIRPVFMSAAFVGMFATAYVVMDGFPRALAEAVRLLSRKTEKTKKRTTRAYWATLTTVWVFTSLVHLVWPHPVYLVTAGALLGLFVSPLYYGLIHYCMKTQIKNPRFAPHRVVSILSLVGIVFVTVMTALWLYLQWLA